MRCKHNVGSNDQRMFLDAMSSFYHCHKDIQNPHNAESILYNDSGCFCICTIFFLKQFHGRRSFRNKLYYIFFCAYCTNAKLFYSSYKFSSSIVPILFYSIMAKSNEYMTEMSHLGNVPYI